MWERGWLSEPLIDRIRGELYVRRIVASSWSERDLTVGVRVCFLAGKWLELYLMPKGVNVVFGQ